MLCAQRMRSAEWIFSSVIFQDDNARIDLAQIMKGCIYMYVYTCFCKHSNILLKIREWRIYFSFLIGLLAIIHHQYFFSTA